jgi:hypothetical protein
MKTIFATIVAATIGLTAGAQTQPGFGLPVADKSPNVTSVDELSIDTVSNQGHLMVWIGPDERPLAFVTINDQEEVKLLWTVDVEYSLGWVQIWVPFVRTDTGARAYEFYCVGRGGKTWIRQEFGQPVSYRVAE